MSEGKEKFQVENERKIESTPDLVERKQKVELPPTVESWMRKLEKVQPQTVTDDQTGQPVMSPTAPVNPKVVLPVTRKVFTDGFSKAVSEAGKWLSEFIFRLIKVKKGEVEFQEEK